MYLLLIFYNMPIHHKLKPWKLQIHIWKLFELIMTFGGGDQFPPLLDHKFLEIRIEFIFVPSQGQLSELNPPSYLLTNDLKQCTLNLISVCHTRAKQHHFASFDYVVYRDVSGNMGIGKGWQGYQSSIKEAKLDKANLCPDKCALADMMTSRSVELHLVHFLSANSTFATTGLKNHRYDCVVELSILLYRR